MCKALYNCSSWQIYHVLVCMKDAWSTGCAIGSQILHTRCFCSFVGKQNVRLPLIAWNAWRKRLQNFHRGQIWGLETMMGNGYIPQHAITTWIGLPGIHRIKNICYAGYCYQLVHLAHFIKVQISLIFEVSIMPLCWIAEAWSESGRTAVSQLSWTTPWIPLIL